MPENYKHDSRSKTSVEVEDKVEKKISQKAGGKKEIEERWKQITKLEKPLSRPNALIGIQEREQRKKERKSKNLFKKISQNWQDKSQIR